MMFKRKDDHKNLCILRINQTILDEPDVIITDKNASSDYVRFYQPKDLDKLDASLIFTDDWRNGDNVSYLIKKTSACAEVLIPERVSPCYITGIYVSCQESYQKICDLMGKSPMVNNIAINLVLFFQGT